MDSSLDIWEQMQKVIIYCFLFNFKIQIRGEILCRLGVLMLTKNNVHVLGGEVESLLEENSPENLLQRAL